MAAVSGCDRPRPLPSAQGLRTTASALQVLQTFTSDSDLFKDSLPEEPNGSQVCPRQSTRRKVCQTRRL